jgi:hypothetical protein
LGNKVNREVTGMATAKLPFIMVLVLVLPVCATATTVYVPDDYETILEAIANVDTLGPPDTILVGPGTYQGPLELPGWTTLRSLEGPAVTIIDGGVRIHTAWDQSVLDGFTITGAYVGVSVGESDVIISNNLIINNESAGILEHNTFLPYVTVTISHNTIVNNGSWGIDIEDRHSDMVRVEHNIVVGHNEGIFLFVVLGRRLICNDCWANATNYYYAPSDISNISEDPLFCDPGAGNYYLAAGSPCLNEPGCDWMGAFPQGCDTPTSVDAESWGEVKALFR